VRRVLEQAVEWVEHLVGEEEEELSVGTLEGPCRFMHGAGAPRNATIIQPRFALERDHQPLLEVIGALAHHLCVSILKDIISSDFNMHIPSGTAHSWLRAEVNQLAAEIALVLRDVSVERGRQTWVVPRRCFCVVVDEVDA